jgi:O-antigen/teichoic acid export membrane protein
MLGVNIAAGVLVFLGPMGAILIPRFTALADNHDWVSLRAEFYLALGATVVVAGAASITLVMFMNDILRIWLNAEGGIDDEVARTACWYALGNLALIIGSLPYYLQVAIGKLKYHLWGAVGSAILYVPAILILVQSFGIRGAGIAWTSINLLTLVWSFWITHKLLSRVSTMRWISSLAPPLLSMSVAAYLLQATITVPDHRGLGFVYMILMAAILATIGTLSSPLVGDLLSGFRSKRPN